MPRGRKKSEQGNIAQAKAYRHTEAESPLRPDVGTQAQFRKKKPPVTYRYDSSLSPALEWDGQNSAREMGEWLISMIEKAFALPSPHTFDTPQEFKNSTGLCFHVCQAFFPRTSAWDNLKRALKTGYEESVWDHLSGTKSVPFEAGEHGQIAVKVIDDRGNELMVVMNLKEVS